MNRKFPSRRGELESIFRGIGFALACIFVLPVIVSAFILTAALLNAGQSLTTVLLPGSYWLALLSFGFRISLIPGFAYLTYRAASVLHDRCGEKRLVVVLSFPDAFNSICPHACPPASAPRISWGRLKIARASRSHLQSGRPGEACARKRLLCKGLPS